MQTRCYCCGLTHFDVCGGQDPFWDKIQKVRNMELTILWRTFVIDASNGFLLNAIPTVVSVTTFTIYVLAGNRLTAAKVHSAPRRLPARPP